MNSESMPRNYRSPLREKQASETRAAIVAALAEQVLDHGMVDFSIPRLAERAGVSVRTVYRYFPNREDLLNAVVSGLARLSAITGDARRHAAAVDALQRFFAGTLLTTS